MCCVTHKVDRFGPGLAFIITPRFAPEPLLWQRLDGDRVYHVVGKVLVEVGKAERDEKDRGRKRYDTILPRLRKF